MRRALIIFVLAVAVSGSLLAATASADIYWGNNGNPCCGSGSSIGRAQNDASRITPSQISGASATNTIDMAANGTFIYWVNGNTGAIMRASPDGSGAMALISAPTTAGPHGIAINGQYLYWTADSGTGAPFIGRANLDGSLPTGQGSYIWIPSSSLPTGAALDGIAVDSTDVYWADAAHNEIAEADLLTGSTVNNDLIPGSQSGVHVQSPIGVASDGTHLYWVNGYEASPHTYQGIGRANAISGASADSSFIPYTDGGVTDPRDVIVSGNFLYWSNGPGGVADGTNSIGRADLTGTVTSGTLASSAVNGTFVSASGMAGPYGLAIDSGAAPANTAPPSFPSSAPTVGTAYTEVNGTYSPAAPATTVAYQWELCDGSGNGCGSLNSATQSYTPLATQTGDTFRVIETPTDVYGTGASVTSAPSPVIASPNGGGGGGGNTTPPTVTTGPATAVGQTGATVNASVNPNGASTTAFFEYGTSSTLAGALSSASQVVPTGVGAAPVSANLTGLTPGTKYYYRVEGVNTASGQAVAGQIMSFTTSVPLGRISSTMTWTFPLFKKFATLTQFEVLRAPIGAKIVELCNGKGCPFASKTVAVTEPVVCKGKGKAKKCKPATAPSTNVDLSKPFKGRHLAYGDKLTVQISRTGYIGKVYAFKIAKSVNPVIGCLAPGSSTAGQGC
jgi:hypothetical protein